MSEPSEMQELTRQIEEFVQERDWVQFHSPKNLSMALTVEASELLEIFQWMSERESLAPDSATREKISDELADVFIYAIQLCQTLDIDLLEATRSKMVKNAEKYPVEKAKGTAKKYDEY